LPFLTQSLVRIVNTVLNWDVSEYQRKLDKLSKSENAPSPDHIQELRDYVNMDAALQEKLRAKSSK
jgi:hypothetical protein